VLALAAVVQPQGSQSHHNGSDPEHPARHVLRLLLHDRAVGAVPRRCPALATSHGLRDAAMITAAQLRSSICCLAVAVTTLGCAASQQSGPPETKESDRSRSVATAPVIEP